MSHPFKFKQFEIIQDNNPQKVGTDSMLLGAWAAKTLTDLSFEPKRILDIGTGTGILALMMAQTFPNAQITAIEPDEASFHEAVQNVKRSPFAERILCIQAKLQDFASVEPFDLIICNPPYYNGTYLSEDQHRNNARHTNELETFELYECAFELLDDEGKLYVIFPHSEMETHFDQAYSLDLSIDLILHTITPKGERKRTLVAYSFSEEEPTVGELLVKSADNEYSTEYKELTKPFYGKLL